MSIVKAKEVRGMTREQADKQLQDLQNELLKERAITSTGGAPENPGRIRELRRSIARILTIRKEEKE
jgi:large subunit ribosomal protein L29